MLLRRYANLCTRGWVEHCAAPRRVASALRLVRQVESPPVRFDAAVRSEDGELDAPVALFALEARGRGRCRRCVPRVGELIVPPAATPALGRLISLEVVEAGARRRRLWVLCRRCMVHSARRHRV